MVKLKNILLSIILLGGVCVIIGCTIDLFGLFGSNDLDKRLQEKDNFKFLSDADRNLLFGDEFSFLVLADTHIQDGNAHGLEKMKTVIDESKTAGGGKEIQFAVFVGDITQYGSRQDIQKFLDIAVLLGIPCYPVIGNHDIFLGNWPAWKDLIGSTRYRVNGGGATLFILDSANSFLGKNQIDWLENGLKSAQGKVFVFSHDNLFVESPEDIQQLSDTKERARVMSVLQGRCDAMFTGHLHKEIMKEAGGVRYISVGGYEEKRAYCRVFVTKTGISYAFEKL